ncbi:MAG TPA: class I SAM-dependent methyltransferase [Herpetosiphonaceae bacterium]|nr:class I SAM-dependent methyltransferase [Herpetosiphonaceae bacterium]
MEEHADTGTISDRIRAAYDRIAADYAELNAAMPGESIDAGTRLLGLTGAGVHILDAGCGAGRDMAWLEAQGARVVGVDLSRGMLAQARQITRGPLAQMDLRRLAFRDSRFGGVWCAASLLHLPKAEAPGALRELHRVLRPGGLLHLSIQEGEGERWESNPDGTVERLFARYSAEAAAALLDGAGFAVLDLVVNDAGTRRWLSFLARRGA